MKETDIAELIGLAYRSVDAPESFELLMKRLTRICGMDVVGISAMGRDQTTFATQVSAGADDPHIREYAERIAFVDPFTAHAMALPAGRVVVAGESLIPRRELQRTEIFDWMHRMSTCDLLLSAEKTEEGDIVSLVGFTSRNLRVQDDHVELWNILSPHVFHAVSLSRQLARLDAENRMAREALALADFGCVFFDENGRADWMNGHAQTLLDTEDGFQLSEDRRLVATDRMSRRVFDQALRDALLVSAGEVAPIRPILSIHRSNGRRPLEVLISPLHPSNPNPFGPLGGAMMVFADPEYVDERFADRLQNLYALTPTEAEIAQWLLSGVPINGIAEMFGNSVHTVRTHVKNVMRKCQVSSQAELVGTLQRSLARLA